MIEPRHRWHHPRVPLTLSVLRSMSGGPASTQMHRVLLLCSPPSPVTNHGGPHDFTFHEIAGVLPPAGCSGTFLAVTWGCHRRT
jgi:hypothetical protein